MRYISFFISATFIEKIEKCSGKLKQYVLYYCVHARKHPEECSQRHYTNVELIEETIEKELMDLLKKKEKYDDFLRKIQQMKMKELWDNKEDEALEILIKCSS